MGGACILMYGLTIVSKTAQRFHVSNSMEFAVLVKRALAHSWTQLPTSKDVVKSNKNKLSIVSGTSFTGGTNKHLCLSCLVSQFFSLLYLKTSKEIEPLELYLNLEEAAAEHYAALLCLKRKNINNIRVWHRKPIFGHDWLLPDRQFFVLHWFPQ